ncbi:unnamed protein product [Ectocarpus sp. CCAP 1310/34]|nr:unnamed protein product [Ectocarpus sp. CCAP 1310/34]
MEGEDGSGSARPGIRNSVSGSDARKNRRNGGVLMRPSTILRVQKGPTRKFCLEALIVALNETCDGKSWYTSTKELQLASLDFCIACRNCQTVHLNVDEQIPRRLLASADAPPPHPKRLCWTRVPRLRSRRVTWNMPTAAKLRTPIFAMTDMEYLEFGDAFGDSLEAVPWPEHLRTMEFHHDSPFDQTIELVQWPPFLQNVTFGGDFNQPIERVKFPASLQQLIFRTSSSRFDQPIAEVVLPASLQLLELGGDFNQPSEDVVWPASLQQLTFGNRLNHPIEGTVWPDSLQTLVVGVDFNQPVDNVRWPASLQELTFGWCDEFAGNGMVIFANFDQPIGSSVGPALLRRLVLGHMFRQSLQGLGTWMPNLEVLHLLHYHGSGLGDSNFLREIEWPKGLRHLTLLEGTSIDGVDIPLAVQVLFAYNECW